MVNGEETDPLELGMGFGSEHRAQGVINKNPLLGGVGVGS